MVPQHSLLNFNENVFNVKFCPKDSQFLAAVTSENFGLHGKGTLHILLHNLPECRIEVIKSFDTSNALFDVSWMPQLNTADLNILTACGDGKLHLWSLKSDQPITSCLAHTKEVTSIDCTNGGNVLSASWDGTIKLWDFANNANAVNLATFQGHHDLVHEVRLSSVDSSLFVSVCGNGTLGFWSTKANKCVFAIKSHDVDVLTCDFNAIDPNLVTTGGSDGIVRYWDVRNPNFPVIQFKASNQAVRKVRFSPHFYNILAVALHDGSTQIWDIRRAHSIHIFRHHVGVVTGLDWSSQTLGLLADCSWDKLVKIFVSNKVRNHKI